MTSKRLNQPQQNQQEQYLYTGASSHPVEEYVDREDALTSDPSFVLDVTWPRIVQFYLPSSKICQEFKPRFIELARDIRHRSTKSFVEFHTISCAVHDQLCANWDVEGVPHVLLFRSGMTESETLERTVDNKLESEYVAKVIGIPLYGKYIDSKAHESDINMPESETIPDSKKKDVSDQSHAIHEPDVFLDAGKSLVYSLQTVLDIQKQQKFLTDSQFDTFHEWIDLLHWALPSRWRLHNLINDIRQNLDTVIVDSHEFHMILHSHEQLIPKKWSGACSHGKENVGYACGIWKLFHIVCIGVAEQHKSVMGEGAVERVSTKKVADILRNFVDDFFSACAECKLHFLDMYDECIHDSCHRLSYDHSSLQYKWRELSLWMWEVHNDINVRVIEESLNRDGRIASEEDKSKILWPSRSDCENCWKNDGNYDNEKIYAYMHNIYW